MNENIPLEKATQRNQIIFVGNPAAFPVELMLS
jgi:hypothetical protein